MSGSIYKHYKLITKLFDKYIIVLIESRCSVAGSDEQRADDLEEEEWVEEPSLASCILLQELLVEAGTCRGLERTWADLVGDHEEAWDQVPCSCAEEVD